MKAEYTIIDNISSIRKEVFPLKQYGEQPLGIYVHLPFCRSKCAYCDFYSKGDGREIQSQMDVYQEALVKQFGCYSPKVREQGLKISTLYFGGGTPTFYGATRIVHLIEELREKFHFQEGIEITVEGNPESIKDCEIALLKQAGVNRISLGMQSAVGQELKAVGRVHTHEQTREAVNTLRNLGIENYSLDLIYGLPLQTRESFEESLEEAISLAPTHLSCYGLKVEEGTALSQRVALGEVLPDEDLQADLYLWLVARLKQAGYQQYEISNFAKEGYESRHNYSYWLGIPYLGFGASASSYYQGERFTGVADLEKFVQGLEICQGKFLDLIYQGQANLSLVERAEEYLFLRLRTRQGISPQEYCQEFGNLLGLDFDIFLDLLLRFQEEGWAEQEGENWRFTVTGFLRSNLLLTALLEVQEEKIQGISA